MPLMNPSPKEFFIVVDIEASGPSPSNYAMLSIGAATIVEPRQTFYIELQPDAEERTEEAMGIHGLSWEQLLSEGIAAHEAMQKFEHWLQQVLPLDAVPVFTAFNAPFDWMFVNDYFHRYLGRNPFGYKALDIKAFYMGLAGVTWEETSHKHVSQCYFKGHDLSHHALEDAIMEAELFAAILQDFR